MSTKSFISEAIAHVVAQLESHPAIVIDECLINPPATADELAKETQLPDILMDFYKESNGVVLAWHVADDPLVRGGIVMPLLENIHNTRWKSFGMLDYTDDVHIAFQKRAEADSRIVMESLLGDEDIEFYDLREPLLDISSYFEAFKKTLGFRFWQEKYRPDHAYSVPSIIEHRGYLFTQSDDEDEEVSLHSAHVPN